MIDVFTEEIEVQIKLGISNLYWYRKDLKKAWLRAGVSEDVCNSLFAKKNEKGGDFTKRELMDFLYESLRKLDQNRRLEISRNFVRILVEHENFVPQDEKHRIDIAERCALKLKEIINKQREEAESRDQIRRRKEANRESDYNVQLSKLNVKFLGLKSRDPQRRGYELEIILNQLMKISGVPVESSFKIEGEQIDGAIKYEGHYYIIEVKWIERKTAQQDISSLYLKIEGKFEARGIYIAMNGYSTAVLHSLPKGKELKTLLFDGVHLATVLDGVYTFRELLEFAINQASTKGEIYCSHNITK